MDLTHRKPGRIVTVFPDPADDSCQVDMVELSEAELNRILDEAGYVPGHPKKGSMQRMGKARQIEVERTIRRVEGLKLDGTPVSVGEKSLVPLFLETEIDVDGETLTLWQHCLNLRAEARKDAEKNA